MPLLPRPSDPRIDVVACTFRRPGLLARLIDALAAQRLDALRLNLIVVDNDPLQSARTVCAGAALRHAGLALRYVSVPQQNIALARNAGLAACSAELIAFIDDDEQPCADWLQNLYRAARDYQAELVFGPVLPDYHPATPAWLIAGGFFERPRHPSGSAMPLPEARTGNVLMSAALIQRCALRFDPALGLSGGEDSEFFRQLYLTQCKAVWCDEAIVSEAVPPERACERWLLRRSFRIGSVESCQARGRGAHSGLARICLKIVYLWARTLLELVPASLCSRAHRLRVWRRGAIGAGLIYGLLFGVFNEYQ
jgi:cellulose synthase/poly-beta-1,6-N-acetylglucosamine synthase-like glycosyltransferase